MSPELVNAAFSGLVLLLGALGGLLTIRGRQAGVRRREYRDVQRRFIAALGHIFKLETALAAVGQQPPARPAILEPDDEDDPPPALPPLPRPDGSARHVS
jgi:hypothetical protein